MGAIRGYGKLKASNAAKDEVDETVFVESQVPDRFDTVRQFAPTINQSLLVMRNAFFTFDGIFQVRQSCCLFKVEIEAHPSDTVDSQRNHRWNGNVRCFVFFGCLLLNEKRVFKNKCILVRCRPLQHSRRYDVLSQPSSCDLASQCTPQDLGLS